MQLFLRLFLSSSLAVAMAPDLRASIQESTQRTAVPDAAALNARFAELERSMQASQQAFTLTVQDLRARGVPEKDFPPQPAIEFYFRYEELADKGHAGSLRWCLFNVGLVGFPDDEAQVRKSELYERTLEVAFDETWIVSIVQMLANDAVAGRFDLARATSLILALEARSKIPETKAGAVLALAEARASQQRPEHIAEAIKLFAHVADKYATTQSGERARNRHFQLENLGLGKTAPDFTTRDVDGVEFKLSDQRGKVVVVTFWGFWCGPCRAQLPGEKALVQRLANEPFALIGINTDVDKVDFARQAKAEGVTWRNSWQGGTSGPLVAQWGITRFPTTYVIDARGVIRFYNPRGAELDRAVDTLLGEMRAPSTR